MPLERGLERPKRRNDRDRRREVRKRVRRIRDKKYALKERWLCCLFGSFVNVIVNI